MINPHMTAPKIDTQAPERVWLDVNADRSEAISDFAGHAWNLHRDEGEVEYIRADLSAAREAAAAQAMREAAAKEIDCEGCGGNCYDPANCWQSAAADIRALPVPDTAALDRLIAERVREAVEAWALMDHFAVVLQEEDGKYVSVKQEQQAVGMPLFTSQEEHTDRKIP